MFANVILPGIGGGTQLFSCVWFFVTPWIVAPQLLCPWKFPGKNTGVGCSFLLQGVFLTQESNPCLLHWQVDSLSLHDWGSSLYSLISVQSLSHVQLFVTPWTTANQAALSITKSFSLPKPMSIDLVMSSNYLILCHPLLLLPSIYPSIKVFSNESAFYIRWPEYWRSSCSISPSSEYSGLISFRIDWLDLFAIQGTLKSLLQHDSLKASFL